MMDRSREQSRLGNYRVLKELGKGGFAIVYLGEHIYLQRKAAIKVLRLNPSQLTSNVLDGFMAEARTIANLEHPHIIRVLEFSVEKTIPYLVMEYAPNGSLQAHHSSNIPLDRATILTYVKQVASALQYAHDRNLVHCDVKPENMLLGRNNEVLLGDFGIAVMIHGSFKTGEAMGTVHYMAPEQFAGKPCPASDQYGLGIVVYRWLCGHFPFNGSSLFEMWRLHREATPPSLRKFMPEISAGVEQVVMKALAKAPEKRFASVQDFATALEEAMQIKQPQPFPSNENEEAEILPTMYLPSLTSLLPKADEPQVAQPENTRNAEDVESNKRIRGREEDIPTEEEIIPLIVVSPFEPRALSIEVTDTDDYKSRPYEAGAKRSMYRGHSSWVSAVAWSPEGQSIASGGWDNTVQVWTATTLQTLVSLTGHTQPVKAVAWSPDGAYLASASWDNTVRILHVATKDELPLYDGHSAQVEDVAWSPDGTLVASAGHDGRVLVWKSSNRRTVCTYTGHTETVWSLSWSPNGQSIASASQDGTVHVWNATTGRHILTYEGHAGHLDSVAWSPKGRYIASAGHDGIIQVWNASTGSSLFSYSHEKGVVKALQWSPDGRYVAAGVKVVDIWDTHASQQKASRNPVFTYEGHSTWVNALSWSPDGRSLVSASDDQTAQVWQPSL